MVDLWYILVCAMFAAYVVLDGYDLGAGIVAPFVAKTDAERKIVLHTILPFWDGNEVYLVSAGATLYLAFPRLFPAFVSGFYLPVMIVLWLLMGRGLGIEMRHKLDQPLWNQLWDGTFFVSSTLLVTFFGAALGNVVRGVNLEANGEFFAPLWTDFTVGEKVGILDWYTLLVAATAVAVIARHGALRLAAHTESGSDEERGVGERSLRAAGWLLPVSVVLVLASTVATLEVQPNIRANLSGRPWTALFFLAAAIGVALSVRFTRRGQRQRAFHASSGTVAALFGCACIGVHPYGLLATNPARSILAVDAAADRYALSVGLAWWLPGMTLVVAYSIFAHRRLLNGAAP